MGPVAARLAGVSLECRDGIDVITDYGRHADVLIYADPPYPAAVRSANTYAIEMQDQPTHERFLTACLAAKAAVMISGYACELYDDLLTGWAHVDLAASTSQGTRTERARVERIWCNRDLAHASSQPGLFEVGA